MAPPQPAIRATSSDRGGSSHYSVRSPVNSEGGSSRISDENRIPCAVPTALGGMLKTTTETSDIGFFSIKPSRSPLPVNSHRRISAPYNDDGVQNRRKFQPHGVPSIDDRRRLPSYARDASSEVASIYERASQKSASRVFDDPDYRSYSMTQTYSSSLSNHRSYASLRSQPDTSGLLQRPRSPFAYPTRLKRPGFRPSSPALTDGGGIDYSRRAEIDRIPCVSLCQYSATAHGFRQKWDGKLPTMNSTNLNYREQIITHPPQTLPMLKSGNHNYHCVPKQIGQRPLCWASHHHNDSLRVLTCDSVVKHLITTLNAGTVTHL
jgi:hypothetical protein